MPARHPPRSSCRRRTAAACLLPRPAPDPGSTSPPPSRGPPSRPAADPEIAAEPFCPDCPATIPDCPTTVLRGRPPRSLLAVEHAHLRRSVPVATRRTCRDRGLDRG